MLDITNIPAPRVPLLEPDTNLISREWYRFFLNLFTLTGSGTNPYSLEDILQAPDFASLTAENVEAIRALWSELGTIPRQELGTMAAVQQDNVRFLRFSNVPSPPIPAAPSVGTVWWDGGTTLNLQMTSNVTQSVGEDQFFYVTAKADITKGQVVMYVKSGNSGRIHVKPAGAETVSDSSLIVGVAAEDIALNSDGLVLSFGALTGVNTNAYADGDILYYDTASTTGGLTNVAPNTLSNAPSSNVIVAAVTKKAGAGAGAIFVRISAGSKLGGTDSNVQISNPPNNNDLIQYNSATGYWKNVAPSSVIVSTATNLAGGASMQIPYQTAPSTTAFSANFVWDYTRNRLGINTVPSYTLDVSYSVSNASGGRVANFVGDYTMSTAGSRSGYGLYNIVNANLSAGSTNLSACVFQTVANLSAASTAATLGAVSGFNFGCSFTGDNSTGRLTNTQGLYVQPANYAGLTGTPNILVDATYGIYVDNQATVVTGVVKTTSYGLYIANQTTGATTIWSLYSAGGNSTFAGNTRFGGTTAPTVAVDVTGAILATTNIRSSGATSGIGYATGAGGTVTQGAGSGKATAVTLNKVCGQITMNNAALAANTTVSFTLTNSAIAAGDVLVLNHISAGTGGAYTLNAQSAAGSAVINVRNVTAGSLSEAIVIAFAVIKAVTA